MDKLFNTCCAPTSKVSYQIKKFDTQILFDYEVLIKLLNTNKYHLAECVEEYYKKNEKTLRNYKKPTGYMIGKYLEPKDKKYRVETDLNLLILVFTQTYGNMYVPTKDPSFSKHRFEHKILFLKKEVES